MELPTILEEEVLGVPAWGLALGGGVVLALVLGIQGGNKSTPRTTGNTVTLPELAPVIPIDKPPLDSPGTGHDEPCAQGPNCGAVEPPPDSGTPSGPVVVPPTIPTPKPTPQPTPTIPTPKPTPQPTPTPVTGYLSNTPLSVVPGVETIRVSIQATGASKIELWASKGDGSGAPHSGWTYITSQQGNNLYTAVSTQPYADADGMWFAGAIYDQQGGIKLTGVPGNPGYTPQLSGFTQFEL